MSNVIHNDKISRTGGISFGEEESFLIAQAIRKFSATNNGIKCSFWGKVLGRNNDYYIIESPVSLFVQNGKEGVHLDEPLGTGINEKAYYVTTDIILGQWEELPGITAK